MRQVCAKSCPATRKFLNVRNENFVVRHYNDAVEYSACDLLSKNTDKVSEWQIMQTVCRPCMWNKVKRIEVF